MHANDGNSHANPFDDEAIRYSDLELDEEPSHPLMLYGNRFFKRLGIKVVPHSLPEEEENDGCEFDIRMSYVPDDVLTANAEPDLVEVRLVTLGKNAWQRTRHKRLLSSLMLLVLCILLIGIALFGHTPLTLFPLSSAQPQATHFTRADTLPPPINRVEMNIVSAGADNAVIINASAMPKYCPAATQLGKGRQIGNFPVWLSSINAGATMIHLPTLTLKTMKGWKGWVLHLRLLGRYKYLTSISLNVLNMYGSMPPLLHNPYTATDSPRLFIDPKHPMGFQGTSNASNIGTWDIPLYLPSAGCYALSASWGQGHWSINFAAGQ